MPCWQQMAPQCCWGEPTRCQGNLDRRAPGLYARGGTKGDAACIKQLNITF